MKLNANVRIIGMKKFKGEVDGVSYDSTTLFIEEGFAEGAERFRGTCPVMYPAGTSEMFERLKDVPFPIQADIVINSVSDGKMGEKRTVVEVKPQRVPAAHHAA